MKGFCARRRVFELVVLLLTSLLLQNLVILGYALNDEGKALLRFKERINKDPFGALSGWEDSSLETHHCSWFGVNCVDGHVVSLMLKDLCLEGTLAPELRHLIHIKLIMLRNNSFSGDIIEDIGALNELEVLDLGYNNFSGPLPHEWGDNISILLLDNNGRFCQISPELEQLMVISEVQVDESHLSPVHQGYESKVELKESTVITDHSLHIAMMRHGIQEENPHHRDLREQISVALEPPSHPDSKSNTTNLPTPASSEPAAEPPAPFDTPVAVNSPPPPPSSTTNSTNSSQETAQNSSHKIIIIFAFVGSFIVLSLIVGLLIWRRKKIASVGPWRTGLSGQLQRSLATDLPKLKRLELETACEEFSNVIGSTSAGTLYKGTLSNGAEIAVLAHAVKTSKDWSKNMDSQFKKKVNTLSELNHKNFLNLLGYCEEERPFSRMLVFEYASCGTLFEHLHIRESEHLDWTARLRVAMGIAYSLEHMHRLNPSIIHENLTTYAINLTEDYAAKVSDFAIWNEVSFIGKSEPLIIDSVNSPETSPEDNIYSFGLILLEMMTGKAPFSRSTGLLNEWALDYLRSETPLQDFVDPMLRHFDVDQLEMIGDVIKYCMHSNPEERPGMIQVALRLREISGIAPDAAAPRLSPMWWAELELLSPRP